MGESQISDVGEAIPVAAIPVALISWATQTALVSPENTAGGGGEAVKQAPDLFHLCLSLWARQRRRWPNCCHCRASPRSVWHRLLQEGHQHLPLPSPTASDYGLEAKLVGAAPAPGPCSRGAPAPLVPTDAFLQAARSFPPMNLHLFSHVAIQCHFVELLFCHQIPFPQPYLR